MGSKMSPASILRDGLAEEKKFCFRKQLTYEDLCVEPTVS